MHVQSCCFTYKTNCFFKSSLSFSWLVKLPFFWSVICYDPVIHCFPWLCSGLGAICMPLKSHLGLPHLTFRLSIAKQTSHLIFQGNYDSCISPKRAEEVLGISDTLVSCTFASLETKRNVACVNFCKDFWDGFWVQRKNWPIAARRVIRNNSRNLCES